MKAGEEARQEALRHLKKRRVLNMDELGELKDPRPRLEKEFSLPGDSRQRNRVYMFSIDGTLRGERLTGCLFAGECIVVQATSFEAAVKIAKDGLRDTIDMAYEYWKESQGALVVAPMDAINVDVGGGRAAANPKQPDLATDPKLKEMLGHAIGKKDWKW